MERVTLSHEDTLVIKSTIVNYDVIQVFVNLGSSINIFKDACDQMQIDPPELQLLSTSLFSFTGHEVRPLGQVNLSLSLEEEPLYRTLSIIFIVVDTVSSYNVILGRPALSAFKIVAFSYYQKIKFSVERQVGEGEWKSKCLSKMLC